MNPSHAKSSAADKTVLRLIGASKQHGYSGWVMLNLYPERSPKPKSLLPYNPALSAANCTAIEQVLGDLNITEVLAGWGDMPHQTLRRAQPDILTMLDRVGVRAFTLDPLTVKGNPRHPSPPGRPLAMLGPKRYLPRTTP